MLVQFHTRLAVRVDIYQATFDDLVARDEAAYERLVASLARRESRAFFRTRREDHDRATQLVCATIQHFLPTLDPSIGNAVLDQLSNLEGHERRLFLVQLAQTLRLDDLFPPGAS